MHILTQPYSKLFYPFKLGLYCYSSLLARPSFPQKSWSGSKTYIFIFAKRKHITCLLLVLSLSLGIIYILEFNIVLNFGRNITILNTELKKIENDLDKNEANYSKIYATTVSSYLNEGNALERVSKIEYVEKKSLVEAVQYIP